MPWSWSNIDWNGTGAMVQAVGSVLAIGAAVVIDQGTARRQLFAERRARAEEEHSRVRAVEASREAAARICHLVDTSEFTKTYGLPDGIASMIARRRDVLERVTNRGAPPAETLEALLIAVYEFRRLELAVEEFGSGPSLGRLTQMRQRAREAEQALGYALDRLTGRVTRPIVEHFGHTKPERT